MVTVKSNEILTWHRPEDGYRNVSRIIETQSTYGAAKPRNSKLHVRDQVTEHLVCAAGRDKYIGVTVKFQTKFTAARRTVAIIKYGSTFVCP
jgi:hypothetical protein